MFTNEKVSGMNVEEASGDTDVGMEVDPQIPVCDGVVVSPPATGTSERHKNPFTFLMEEMWDVILNNLDDSESIHNLLLAYPLLWSTFQNKIPLWLFEQIFPHLLPYLTPIDVRKCTLVCKTWRRNVHHFVEEHPYRRPYNEKEGNNPIGRGIHYMPCALRDLDMIFSRHDTTQKFIRIVPTHLNPFIGRSVSLSFLEFEIDLKINEYKAHATTLLKKYGKFIWNLEISQHPIWETGQNFYQRLVLSLSLLPNLRSLVIRTDELSWSVAPGASQLPPLPHLESLTFLRFSSLFQRERINLHGIFVAMLRRYGTDKLRCLSWPVDYCQGPLDPCVCNIIDEFDLSGITDLRLNKQCSYLDDNHLTKILSRFSKENLQKLQVTGNIWEDREDPMFRNLFGFKILVLDVERTPLWLGKYCEKSCESLKKCTKASEVAAQFNLPNLHTLRINNHQLNSSYKFLVHIPTLKTLHLRFQMSHFTDSLDKEISRHRVKRNKYVQRYGCHYDNISEELHKWIYSEPKMDKSLVWKLLPGLQTLFVCHAYKNRFLDKDGVRYYTEDASRVQTYHRIYFI